MIDWTFGHANRRDGYTPADSEWKQSQIAPTKEKFPARTNKQIRPTIVRLPSIRFVPGEEDGLRDRFLDDLHSVRHIDAVTRRQTCDARAPRPAVRAIGRWRRRANAFYEATGIRVRE